MPRAVEEELEAPPGRGLSMRPGEHSVIPAAAPEDVPMPFQQNAEDGTKTPAAPLAHSRRRRRTIYPAPNQRWRGAHLGERAQNRPPVLDDDLEDPEDSVGMALESCRVYRVCCVPVRRWGLQSFRQHFRRAVEDGVIIVIIITVGVAQSGRRGAPDPEYESKQIISPRPLFPVSTGPAVI